MTYKLSSICAKMLLVAFFGLLMAGNLRAVAADSKSARTNSQDDLLTVGIINPDGVKSVWLIPRTESHAISVLLAEFPSKVIDGLKFYSVSSWQDTARILAVVNEQQARSIRHLVQNVRQLNKRVGSLEKKRGRHVYSGTLDYRLSNLEKKVKYMSDGGYP